MARVAAPLRPSFWPSLSSLFAADHHLALPFSGDRRSLRRLFSAFPSPRSAGRRAHALRPTGSPAGASDLRDDGSDSDSGGGEPGRKSRNELKREARRSLRWGMELASFTTPQIKRVLRVASLDEPEVLDALMLVKRLGPDVREGKRRQFNYIGRLLRTAEPELMDALIQASKDGDNDRLLALSGQETWSKEDDDEEEESEDEQGSENYIEVASRWFDGLISKDLSITNEVYSLHNVEYDRQELRKLVRGAQSIHEESLVEENDVMVVKAKKPLIRFLCSLAKKASAE